MLNPYLPYPVRIDDITIETEDKNLKTFKFVFMNSEDEERGIENNGTIMASARPIPRHGKVEKILQRVGFPRDR